MCTLTKSRNYTFYSGTVKDSDAYASNILKKSESVRQGTCHIPHESKSIEMHNIVRYTSFFCNKKLFYSTMLI